MMVYNLYEVNNTQFNIVLNKEQILLNFSDKNEDSNSYYILEFNNLKYGFIFNRKVFNLNEENNVIYLDRSKSLILLFYDRIFVFSLEIDSLIFIAKQQDEILGIAIVDLGFIVVTETSLSRINDINGCTVSSVYFMHEVITEYSLKKDVLSLQLLNDEVLDVPLKQL